MSNRLNVVLLDYRIVGKLFSLLVLFELGRETKGKEKGNWSSFMHATVVVGVVAMVNSIDRRRILT
jgi:uncharacterized membrane protein